MVAAHSEQRHRVGSFLDADRSGDTAEAVGQVDDGLAERRIDLAGGAIGDEGPVEFDFGERQLFELSKDVQRRPQLSIAKFTSNCLSSLAISLTRARSATSCSSITSMTRPGHLSNCGR